MARKRTYSERSDSPPSSLGKRSQYRENSLLFSSPSSSPSRLSALPSSETCSPRSDSALVSKQAYSAISIANLHMDNTPLRSSNAAEPIIIYDIDNIEEMYSTPPTGLDQDVHRSVRKVSALQLDAMPKEIVGRIFEYVLQCTRTINPRFKSGMLLNGVYSPNWDDMGVSKSPNIDASLFTVNKRFHEIASEILYGRNCFFFEDAAICKWWCKHIGDHNLARVHHIKLVLDSGWWVERLAKRTTEIIGPSDSSFEEMWYTAICRFKKGAPLETIIIRLDGWDKGNGLYPLRSEEAMDELRKWRSMIMYKLAEFRGLKEVQFIQFGKQWLSKRQVNDMVMMMKQSPSQAPSTLSNRPMSLSEHIQNIKNNRLQGELMRRTSN